MKLNNPKIRFNMGYHDGACGHNLSNGGGYLYSHFDKIYLAGWQLGNRDHCCNQYAGDSSSAFKEYQNKRRA